MSKVGSKGAPTVIRGRENGEKSPSGAMRVDVRAVLTSLLAYFSMGILVFVGAGCGDDSGQGGDGDAGAGGDALVEVDAVAIDASDPNSDDDGDGYTEAEGDCNDSDPAIHPGAQEICDDGVDNDCNGYVDTAEPDEDEDGWGPCVGDCDDEDPNRNPGMEEIPGNGVDDNCDGIVDGDYDGDGFTEGDGDCDDTDPQVYPGADENCYDGVDNDCNGYTDAEEPDMDGDGFGPCEGDCDDSNPEVNPGQPEIGGNGIDDNCDYLIDEDIDGDGFTVANGDCDDEDPEVRPGVVEACDDGIDNNCDGITDVDCFDPCKVSEGQNAVGVCTEEAPPNSFDPEVQWVWNGNGSDLYSIVTPLVANMTDDDGNGEIDLCDVPDVLVVASSSSGSPGQPGHIYILDGATGTMLLQFPTAVDHTVTPAIGDIDGDLFPEVVTTNTSGYPVAFEHDGTLKWTSSTPWSARYSGAIALADMDNDGDVEIVAGNMLYDHLGNHLWTASEPAGPWSATAVADLDGDGDGEMVLGHAAFHHDGNQLYVNTSVNPGYPQVANLDADPEPEVLVTNRQGLTLLNHDGTVIYADLRPTGVAGGGYTTWVRPATIHDFDGDGAPEFASSSASWYAVYEADGSILWQASVSDQSGIAAGTAFDFLGDGTAEAMYADEHYMFIFDISGNVLLQSDRTSGTLSEYPVVADIDNDGSAEIVVVSNNYGGASPTVQVIKDIQDRWIQARRIWNQHTYHVTNVREDAVIPQFEQPHWERLNTFRTNAQIQDGIICAPDLN